MVSWKTPKNKSLGANLAAGVSWGSRNHDVGCLISWPHVFDRKFVAARFVPEGEFDPIPESEFVVDDAQVVFYDVLSRTQDFCDFTVLESLSDERNYPPLSLVRNTFP
jgi:hypothetical protein